MIFLVLSEKMIFLFPESMILFFRRKRKDGLSLKNIRKYDAFFFKKKSYWNMIFFVICGKVDLSQKILGNMIFLCICINVTNIIFS